MLASVFGYAGSQLKPEFLSAYLIVGAVGTVAQFVIVLAIFSAQAEVADAIENMKSSSKGTVAYFKEKDREFVLEKLEIGKWVFLWVVLGQACSLGPAINVSQDNVDSSWPELVPYLYAILKDLTQWCSWSRQGGFTLQRQLKARSIQKTIQNPVMKVSFALINADIPEDHMLEKGKGTTGKKEAQAKKGRIGGGGGGKPKRKDWT